MELISVNIQNYKCIDDSGVFGIADLTCLAGKNESGKTALLQALRRLNPVEEAEKDYNQLMEYPRRRLREAERLREVEEEDKSLRQVVTTTWELSDDDLGAIERELGISPIIGTRVIIKRGYDNMTKWDLEIDHRKIVCYIVSQVSELTENSKEKCLEHDTLGSLHSYLSSIENPNEGENVLLGHIEANFPNADPEAKLVELLNRSLPRFLYFPTYGTLPGRISVRKVLDAARGNSCDESIRYFLALLALANTKVEDLQDARSSEERIARIEAISNSLSDEIFAYWTQNQNLEVEFTRETAGSEDPPELNGEFFSLRVRNRRHRVTVRFDERSTGFVWFFSFLVWFSQMEREHGDNLIILLDEPGLSLHGKAQRDLLRFIKEKLLPKYQVIYTTHSPFMIDTDNILNVRTVEDVVSSTGGTKGTKVSGRVLSADADTLFPLRAALGYDITQSLFVGEHCLLVEGASDLLYLQWFSQQLSKRNGTGLDSRWTVTPVGGISKFGSFSALFASNKLHIAILTDYRSGDKRKVRDLKESELLQAGHVFCAADFVDNIEADIEDMVGRDFYIELINSCYELEGSKRVASIRPEDAPTLILEEIEQHFRVIATEGPPFNHLSPAVYLMENGSSFCQSLDITSALDRFAKLFQKLNDLLP